MDASAPQPTPLQAQSDCAERSRVRRVRAILGIATLAVLGLAGVWAWRHEETSRGRPNPTGTSSRSTAPDPSRRDRSKAGIPAREVPFSNLQGDVKYVGDAVCARCHAEISRSFAEHPMGHSLRPHRELTTAGVAPFTDRFSFDAQGLRYGVESGPSGETHVEVRRDSEQRTVAQNRGEARYVIGSGRRAYSFLVERAEGYLFESPITWYAQEHVWDLSPGFDRNNPHFERPIRPACLFCHSNRVEAVEGSENHYREPIFQGHAIGCERCHGPGELHARQPFTLEGQLPNIANPSMLEPTLREAVCQQCHLQGDIRIERAGTALTEYRPGLPLHAFTDVFLQASKLADHRFVGQVEQMYASRCFQESQGKLGCISCHDPHRAPAPAERVAYFRGRCLDCHDSAEASGRSCALPRRERLERNPQDSCIDCHMPRAANSRIPHTATSNHRIPRNPAHPENGRSPITARRNPQGIDELFLVSFFRDLREQDQAAGREPATGRKRDLGVALSIETPNLKPAASEALARADRLAVSLLEEALIETPADPDAWQARGRSLWRLGRRSEAMDAFRSGLKLAPDRESILLDSASRAAQLGNSAEALSLADRLVALNPWRADYHHLLARIHVQRRNWREVVKACRSALALNAHDLELRLILIQALIRLNDAPTARDEFETFLKYDPPQSDGLRRWFSGQMNSAGNQSPPER